MARMLKHSDKKLHAAYVDIFLLLTKAYLASENVNLEKFIKGTFEELLKAFLAKKN